MVKFILAEISIFGQFYCFGKSDFCGVVNVRKLTNCLMEKLYASLKLYVLCDHIELSILIILGIINSSVVLKIQKIKEKILQYCCADLPDLFIRLCWVVFY